MVGLDELIDSRLSGVIQDPRFRLTIDTHHSFFLTPGNYDIHFVDDHTALKYRYDLTGYLTASNIPAELHYAIMRLTGMTSFSDFSWMTQKALFIPTLDAYREVVSRYHSSFGEAV